MEVFRLVLAALSLVESLFAMLQCLVLGTISWVQMDLAWGAVLLSLAVLWQIILFVQCNVFERAYGR